MELQEDTLLSLSLNAKPLFQDERLSWSEVGIMTVFWYSEWPQCFSVGQLLKKSSDTREFTLKAITKLIGLEQLTIVNNL